MPTALPSDPLSAQDLAPSYGRAVPEPVLYRMPFAAPLLPGVLLRRRDRFLADILLDSGETIVAHCVNTGRMEGLTLPGRRVHVSRATSATRRLAFTWELTEVNGVIIGTNTAIPNRLVLELLTKRLLPPFADHSELCPERRFGERSRVDFWLRRGGREHYVEVKNCHLVYPDGLGYFPDSISERATHHLHELSAMVRAGHEATVLFVVQRADVQGLRPSDVHDPAFATAARAAGAAGVRFLALCVEPRLDALLVRGLVPVDLEPYDLKHQGTWRENLRAEAPAWESSRPRRATATADVAPEAGFEARSAAKKKPQANSKAATTHKGPATKKSATTKAAPARKKPTTKKPAAKAAPAKKKPTARRTRPSATMASQEK